jgi:hypothetical protein
MKRPITGVVPQLGATLPYSMFNGLRISPKRVFSAIANLFVYNLNKDEF